MRALIILLLAMMHTGAAFSDVTGRFTFERLGGDVWRAKYCFDEPVEVLGFERPIENFRESSWRTLLPEYELSFHGGAAQIARADGEPFRCTGVEMDTYTAVPIKNYMAFSSFTDGGMVAYTGYMTGKVFKDGVWQAYDVRARYKGLPGETVIARDPAALDHQYVYFGPQTGLSSANMRTVIDPGMPAAALVGIEKSLPEASKLLEDLFSFKPLEPFHVYMAAGELMTSKEDHSKGGSLKRQILFTLKGKRSADWAIGSPDFYPKLAAHEVLHLWQNEVWYGQLGEDTPWVHEGGADAIAHELMLRAGVYTAARYNEVWKTVESRCAGYLEETSVDGAIEAGKFDTLYQCGALINRIIAQALNSGEPSEGLFRFWRAMASWDETDIRQTPSAALFFATMDQLGFTESQIGVLKDFLAHKHADGEASVSALRSAFSLSNHQ